jgi:hypothetical protein
MQAAVVPARGVAAVAAGSRQDRVGSTSAGAAR